MLTKKSKYAIKALVALAKQNQKGQLTRIGDISEQENIPKKFLETIMLELRKHGMLASKLGANGGYYLLKKPADIHLVEIIRLMDGPIALIPCASMNFYQKCDDCTDEITCGLRKVVVQLRDANLSILNRTTIEDVAKSETVKSQKIKILKVKSKK